jgi:hypothetical protein
MATTVRSLVAFFIFIYLCWQHIEMSGSVTNELSALSTPVVGNVGRLFYWFRTFF